ncbi:MAG: hypothetical protein KAR22_26955, partial [Gammaproteobacteria bacterium]|nr:hypothetical protein [Gammaproteobacteria bacterium]
MLAFIARLPVKGLGYARPPVYVPSRAGINIHFANIPPGTPWRPIRGSGFPGGRRRRTLSWLDGA